MAGEASSDTCGSSAGRGASPKEGSDCKVFFLPPFCSKAWLLRKGKLLQRRRKSAKIGGMTISAGAVWKKPFGHGSRRGSAGSSARKSLVQGLALSK